MGSSGVSYKGLKEFSAFAPEILSRMALVEDFDKGLSDFLKIISQFQKFC